MSKINYADQATVREILSKIQEVKDNAVLSDGSGDTQLFIACHYSTITTYAYLKTLAQWNSVKSSSSYHLDGIAIVENGRVLVVAPEEASSYMTWSPTNKQYGELKELRAACEDMDGEGNTATIIAAMEEDGVSNPENYAAGFCNAYEGSDTQMGAGKWWLPSVGEWLLIWKHLTGINYLLSQVGGTQIRTNSSYWTSSERTASLAWYFTTTYGYVYGCNFDKAGNGNYVRPVSAFQ